MAHLTTLLYVAAIAVLSGLPGALMLLSPVALFKVHGNVSAVWGLSPLEDQQIAGLIMWVPAGLFFLLPIVALFVKTMQGLDGRARRNSNPKEAGVRKRYAASRGPSPARVPHGR